MALLGAPTTRDHIASALEGNLRKYFISRQSKLARESKIPLFYNVDPSDRKIERHAVYAGLGTFSVKAEGGILSWDSGQEAWNKTYTHKTFALGIQVTLEATQDDLHGVIASMTDRGGDLATVAEYTRERDAMDLFNSTLTTGAVYTAGGTDYPLLSTTHFRVDGSTWSNRPTAALDLSIEALEFMIGHWLVNQVNQRGQVLMTMPERLLVGASDWALSRRLLRSVQIPQSNANDPNVVRDVLKDSVTHPLLTNDGRWLVFGPKEELGTQYYNRVRPTVIRVADDGNTLNIRFVAYYRESHGATHVSGIWGSP